MANRVGYSQTSTVNEAKGVWNLFDQYYWKKDDQWPKDFISAVTGGTVATPGDGYRYHTFTSSGSLEITGTASLDVDRMWMTGGGQSGNNRGGGWEGGGGGGGGESLDCVGPFLIKAETHTVTVGSGGASKGPPGPANVGGTTQFTDSVLGTIETGYCGQGAFGNGGGGQSAASSPNLGTVGPNYEGAGVGTVTSYKANGGGHSGAGRGSGGGGCTQVGFRGGSGPARGGDGVSFPWAPGGSFTIGGGGGGGHGQLQGYPGNGGAGAGGGANGGGGAGSNGLGGGGGGSRSNPNPSPGGPGGSGRLVIRYTADQIVP